MDTLRVALDRLLVKWERNARQYDDYRGILMCMKELKEAMEKTDAPLPADVKSLITRAELSFNVMKGKPFFTNTEVMPLLADLLTAVKALSVLVEKPVTVKTK